MNGAGYDRPRGEEFKRIASSVVFVAISWLIFVAVFILIFMFPLFPRISAFKSYYGEFEEVDENDEPYAVSVSLGYKGIAYTGDDGILPKGSLILLREFDVEYNPVRAGDVFAFIDDSGKVNIKLAVSANPGTTYQFIYATFTDLDGTNLTELSIAQRNMLGSIVEGQYTTIPFVGNISALMASNRVLGIILFVLSILLLVVTPLLLVLWLRKIGYGMGNMGEQARVAHGVFGILISAAVLAVIVVALYMPALSPGFNLFGQRVFVYNGENIENDDIKIAKGSYAIAPSFEYGETLAAGDYFAVKVPKSTSVSIYRADSVYDNGEKLEIRVIGEDGSVINLSNADVLSIVTTSTLKVPVLGTIVTYLNFNIIITVVGLIILALLFIALPIKGLLKRIKVARRISPFKEGIDKSKLNAELGYIYNSIRVFLKEGGMQMKHGYNSDEFYIGKKLFCRMALVNRSICVYINKNFETPDGRIDRRGFIRIEHASEINSAKDRIYDLYNDYFRKYKSNGNRY